MNYDPKPMAVVISNSLDPVVQRQLYAGIRADIMTADQVEEQHEDQQTIQESIPEPDVSDDVDSGNDINGEESSDTAQTDEVVEGDVDNTSTDESSDEPAEANSDVESSEESPEDEDGAGSESEEDSQEEASVSDDEGAPTDEDSESDSEGNDEADLEAIKSGTGFEAYFAEDAEGEQEVPEEEANNVDQQQVIKSLFFIRADTEGLTPEQENLPGVITKPKDAIVVIDKTEVPNLEVGKQLTDLENRLVGMGVAVKDNIQEAIELINEISDGIAEASGELSQEGLFDSFRAKPKSNLTLAQKVTAIRKALAGDAVVNRNLKTVVPTSLDYWNANRNKLPSDFIDKVIADFEVIKHVFTPTNVSKYLKGINEVMKRDEDYFANLDLTDMSGALAKFKGKTFDKVAGAWVKSKHGKVPVNTLGLVTRPNLLVYQDGSLASESVGFFTDAGPLELHEIEALLNVFDDLGLQERLSDCERHFDNTGNAGHAVEYYLVEAIFDLLDGYVLHISTYIDWAYQSIQTK